MHLVLKALKVNFRHSCIRILTSKLAGTFFFLGIFQPFLRTSPSTGCCLNISLPLVFRTSLPPSLLSTSLSSLLQPLAPPCLLSSLKYWCSLGPCSCAFFLILYFTSLSPMPMDTKSIFQARISSSEISIRLPTGHPPFPNTRVS